MTYTEMMQELARKLHSNEYNKVKLFIDVVIRDVLMTSIGYVAYSQILGGDVLPPEEERSMGISIGASIVGTHVPAIYNFIIHPLLEKLIISRYLGDEAQPLSALNGEATEELSRMQKFGNVVKNAITRDLPALGASFGLAGVPKMFGAPVWATQLAMVHTAAFFSTAISRRDTEQGVTPATRKSNHL